MASFTVDPLRKFEIHNSGVSPLLCSATTPAIGSDRLVVDAVSAKRIRVMGILATSTGGTVGNASLKSGSGGSVILNPFSVQALTSGTNWILPITETGYCETATGVGLYTDVAASDIYLNTFYISYTP